MSGQIEPLVHPLAEIQGPVARETLYGLAKIVFSSRVFSDAILSIVSNYTLPWTGFAAVFDGFTGAGSCEAGSCEAGYCEADPVVAGAASSGTAAFGD